MFPLLFPFYHLQTLHLPLIIKRFSFVLHRVDFLSQFTQFLLHHLPPLFLVSYSPPPSCPSCRGPHPSRTTFTAPSSPSPPLPSWPCPCSIFSSVFIIPMPFTISNISLGDLLSCFRPRGLLPGLTTLLVDKVDRELVGLEVKVLLLLPPRLVRLNGDEFIFTKLKDWSETLQNNSNNLQTDCLQITLSLNFLHFPKAR